MTETPDEVMARAGEVLGRATEARLGTERFAPPPRKRRAQALAQRLGTAAIVDGGILFIALMIGLTHPIGMVGFVLLLALLCIATAAIVLRPAERVPSAEKLREADLRTLPRQTERWLAAQRPALPAPAVPIVDRIGARLGQLEPQLAALDAHAPAAEELRALVAEQLPEFVRGYQRVPATLRATPRNGKTPDAQLVDGLGLIERQLADMSEQLAQGDLDTLATRGRYLEVKYRGE